MSYWLGGSIPAGLALLDFTNVKKKKNKKNFTGKARNRLEVLVANRADHWHSAGRFLAYDRPSRRNYMKATCAHPILEGPRARDEHVWDPGKDSPACNSGRDPQAPGPLHAFPRVARISTGTCARHVQRLSEPSQVFVARAQGRHSGSVPSVTR